MKPNLITIEGSSVTGRGCVVRVDGQIVPNVRKLTLSMDIGAINVLTLELVGVTPMADVRAFVGQKEKPNDEN